MIVVMLDVLVAAVDPHLGSHIWSEFLSNHSERWVANKQSTIFLLRKEQWKFVERGELWKPRDATCTNFKAIRLEISVSI
jgi:hypothetical protein